MIIEITKYQFEEMTNDVFEYSDSAALLYEFYMETGTTPPQPITDIEHDWAEYGDLWEAAKDYLTASDLWDMVEDNDGDDITQAIFKWFNERTTILYNGDDSDANQTIVLNKNF